jgi:RNA polymerase sigma factor (sigma-70 family)
MTAALLQSTRRVFNQVRRQTADDCGDGELLDRFRSSRDDTAFGVLVHRHGPMVFGVCRRVLGDPHAAEDAFQATFLVLARKAGTVRPPGVLGAWLYGVAYRTALKARGREYRRRQVEQDYAGQLNRPGENNPSHDADLRRVIDEQLVALPEKYRLPLVMCAVQGLGKAEAAERLGLPEGTVSSRLARARDLLRDRLTRRGVVVPAAALAILLAPRSLLAAVPRDLANTATDAAVGLAPIEPAILTLTHEVLSPMTTLSSWKLLGAIAVSLTLAGGGFGVYLVQADEKEKPAAEKPRGEKPNAEKPRAEKPGADRPREKPRGDEGERPVKRPRAGGKITDVRVNDRVIAIIRPRDNGDIEEYMKLAKDAKILVDGEPAELKAVPRGAIGSFNLNRAKEGELAEITELHVNGPSITAVLKGVKDSTLTYATDAGEKSVKVDPKAKISTNRDAGKLEDFRAGEKVTILLSADQSRALAVSIPRRGEREKAVPRGDREKGTRRVPRLSGKVDRIDAERNTITLLRKGDGGLRTDIVPVDPKATIIIDGKPAKLADIKPEMNAEAVLEGEGRAATEIRVAGPRLFGIVKDYTADTVTIGGKEGKPADQVFKLAPGGKVLVDGKESKFTDLQAGDRATVLLTSDGKAIVSITVNTRGDGDQEKPAKEGDKPRKEKPEGDDEAESP